MYESLLRVVVALLAFLVGWCLCSLFRPTRPTLTRVGGKIRRISEPIRRVEFRDLPEGEEPMVVVYPAPSVWRQYGTIDPDEERVERMPQYGEIDVV